MSVDQNTEALPNAADKEQLRTIAPVVVTACPGLQEEAHAVASEILKKHGVTDRDPDHVYYHRIDTAQSSTKSFTGWEHINAKARDSMTLTQLVIHRFRVTDQDNADLLDMNGGFYSVGPDAQDFDDTNEVRLHGNEVLKDFWDVDFSERYTQKLNAFWKTHFADFRTLAKCNYLSKAVEARQNSQLNEEDFQTVIEAVACNANWPITLSTLQAETSAPAGLRISALDVAGHVSTDILRIVDRSGQQILYVPGATEAFHVHPKTADLHWWVLLQMNDDTLRTAFMTHFPLEERQAISDNLTSLMNQLTSTWGKSDHSLINQKNIAINGDAFTWQCNAVQAAMLAEAALALTSNAQMRKQMWQGYLSAGLQVFGPLAMLGWPIALPVIGASLTAMGLNIDKAVNGKTAADRKAGIIGAVVDGIITLFNIPLLKEVTVLEDVGASVEAAEAAEMAKLREDSIFVESVKEDDPRLSDDPQGETSQSEELAPQTSESGSSVEVPKQWQCHETLSSEMLKAQSGKFRGIYSLTSNPSSAIRMNGAAWYVRYEADINGGGTWAIIDPKRPNAFTGSIPVRLNAEGEWEISPRTELKGGMEVPSSSGGEASQPLVEVWAREPGTYVKKLRTRGMREWALGGPDEMITAFDEEAGVEVRTSRFAWRQREARENLILDAEAYYESHPPLPRAQMSSPPPFKTAQELFQTAAEQKSGLVFGETRGSVGSKKLLIDNMPTLARSGFKRLYLQELLTNANQVDLDTFARTGEMPEDLETYLKKLDITAGNDPDGEYNLLALVKAANEHKIRVQALDCAITYNINGHATLEPEKQMARSFFASEVIRLNEQAHGADNWIALLDRENMSTFRGYRGVSEQVGAVSVRIDDVTPGMARPVATDSGATIEYENYPDSPVHDIDTAFDGLSNVRSRIKGDWHLQVETPWSQKSPTELEHLLPDAGMYTFQRSEDGVLLVYRNANRKMSQTLISTTADGRMVLEKSIWPDFNFKPIDNLDALKKALTTKGMKLMGWSVLEIADEASGGLAESLDVEMLDGVPQHWQANELLEGQTPVSEPGKYQGIYRLNSNPSAAILMNDVAWYVRYEADINGGGTWAIFDPSNPNAFQGSIPVHLNAQGEWEITVEGGLKGGADDLMEPVAGSSRGSGPVAQTPSTKYGVTRGSLLRKVALGLPETHVKIVRQLDGTLRGLSSAKEHLTPLRMELLRDSRSFYSRSGFFTTLPARPVVPAVTRSTTVANLLQKIFKAAPGLVIGESQDRIASMRFLIENMQTLARQGVKTLYLHRLLSDFNQVDLDAFFNSGADEMSADLQEYLTQLQSDPSGKFTPLRVVELARENGIRIQATDCLASYKYEGTPFIDVQEQSIQNYLTHTIMHANEALNGPGKWVVVTGQENTNTFRDIAGISEMNGGIGLRIEEVIPEHGLQIEIDQGIQIDRYTSPQQPLWLGDFDTLYADISLKMPTPIVQRTPSEIARILFRQGSFAFEESNGTWTLVHRSRTREIIRTLIERTAEGKYLINRPAWVDIHQIPYERFSALSRALVRMGMTLEGRVPL